MYVKEKQCYFNNNYFNMCYKKDKTKNYRLISLHKKKLLNKPWVKKLYVEGINNFLVNKIKKNNLQQ